MKNSLKRAASLIALGAVAASACSINAFADSKFSPDGGFSAEQIAASAVKPTLTATQKVITLEEAKNAQTISITVTGAEEKYASTGMHIYYDKGLSIETNRFGKPNAGLGAAGAYLTTKTPDVDPTAEEFGMEGIFVTTAGEEDFGLDGELIVLNVTIEDPQPGAVYPIDIIYRSNKTNEDLFVNKDNDNAGKLMQAYTWTQGIYNTDTNNKFNEYVKENKKDDIAKCPALANIAGNMDGYIAIEGGTTPTEPPTTAPTTAPTTEATTEPTTAPTSVASTAASTEASTAASTEASTEAATTAKKTTAKKTTAKKTTAKKTTAKKDDSPKTGVAGAGVAVAGLAVAIGTAFVLRKKED